MTVFNEDEPSLGAVCQALSLLFDNIATGASEADRYHRLVMGTLTALFYPDLILPKKEWEIHGGRKRIDIVYTNAANAGFFAQRRSDQNKATMVVTECKNYSSDIGNPELDQLLGRFDVNRGKFGFLCCRNISKTDAALERCKDAASRQQGFIIILTDDDFKEMLLLKSQLKDDEVQSVLHRKMRDLIA